MRFSIFATALALVAQVAWAQESTDPVVPALEGSETGSLSQETASETAETEVTETDTAEETLPETEVAEEPEVVQETQTEVAEETETGTPEDTEPEVEETEPEVEVTEEDSETEEVVDEEEPVTAIDNRSPNGQFHGGHRGSVSTLAHAGLGPVFGKLRSQGYGDIQIEQVGDEIMIDTFSRDGQMRRLTYDATTGALLSDEPGQPNLIQSITNTFRKDRVAGAEKSRQGDKGKSVSAKSMSAGSGSPKGISGPNGHRGSFGVSKGNGAESMSNGNGNGNGNGGGQGGGNGKGNGGGQGGGRNK